MQKIFIFLDESWLSGNRYWGLGRKKWDKIRSREWAWKYKCIVNLFMNYEMYLSALIVDSHLITLKN